MSAHGPATRGERADRVRPLPAAEPRLRLTYSGVARPVRLTGAPDVCQGLAAAISGWSPEISAENGPETGLRPFSTVERRGAGYRLNSDFLDEPLHDLPAASAVCGVIADLSQAFFSERPGCMALHCGAFLIAGRLVAMTGHARAGKSTLMARLTAEPDLKVLCDDVLPILSDGLAYGLGLAPRLRLPLPAGASALFRAHVAAHTGLADDKYAYVTAPTVAPHGTRAPLSVFVVLDRREGGPARLHRVDPAEAVHHLLAQNMADRGEGSAAFERVTRMAGTILCLKLVYSDLEDTVTLIRRAFGGTALPDPSVPVGAPLPFSAQTGRPLPAPPVDRAQVWRRCPQVAVRRVGNEGFLWHAGNQGWFHLNPVAAAIWTLLEEPDSGDGISGLLAEVFPRESRDRIQDDVARLLGALAQEQLILPA